MLDTLGFNDWSAFLAVLNQKRDKVKVQFKQLIQEKEFSAEPVDDFCST